jgi:hypothetical protein
MIVKQMGMIWAIFIDASHQISAHFGKAISEKKIFRNRPI